MNMEQSHLFGLIKGSYEVVGPITYDYIPGTTLIIPVNKLAHLQYPELDRDAVIIEDCDLLHTTVALQGGDQSSIVRTKFCGGENPESVFVTRLDKREANGQMTFKTVRSATYSEAVKQHIELVQSTTL